MIIINSFFKFRSKTLLGNTEKLWIIIAIIEICTAIFYIIAIQVGFFLYTERTLYGEQYFWVIYDIQLGTIVPFISAGITVIGAIIGKLVNRDVNKLSQI